MVSLIMKNMLPVLSSAASVKVCSKVLVNDLPNGVINYFSVCY